MIDNIEFIALIVTILGTFAGNTHQIHELRKEMHTNQQDGQKQNHEIKIEFAKCPLHGCGKETET